MGGKGATMELERKVTPVSLAGVPLGRLATWESGDTRCLGIRVSVQGAEDRFWMMELSPLDNGGDASPDLSVVDDPDTEGALLFSEDYFIDHDLDDALQISLGAVEFKPWRIVVSGEKAHLMVESGRRRAVFDLASGRQEAPAIGPKFALDSWRIVRVLPSGEREVLFERKRPAN